MRTLLAAIVGTLALAQAPVGLIEWKRISLPFENQVLLDPVWLYNPATKSTFVGAKGKGLFETKDGGDSWTRVDDGSFVTSGINTDIHTLSVAPNRVLYSIDIDSGVYKSENDGKHWTKAFTLMGYKGRIWIDADRPASIYSLTAKATESEPAQTYTKFRHSTDGGTTFQDIEVPLFDTGSIDINGRLMCYAAQAAIRCSENGTTWQSLSLTPIAGSLAIDRDLNSSVRVTINRTNRELVIQSGGTVYETRNGRTVIAPKVTAQPALGRVNDLIFDASTFPAYGISALPDAWMLMKIAASGAMETYAGPKPKGFRLKAVDVAHATFYVWTLEGHYRGVLK